MAQVKIYFSENMLRGYCHVKYMTVRTRDKVARTLGELSKKSWFSPVRSILLAIVTVAALAIILDMVIKLGT